MDPTNPHHLFIEAMKHVLRYALESSRDAIMNVLAVADWIVIRFFLAAMFSACTPISKYLLEVVIAPLILHLTFHGKAAVQRWTACLRRCPKTIYLVYRWLKG